MGHHDYSKWLSLPLIIWVISLALLCAIVGATFVVKVCLYFGILNADSIPDLVNACAFLGIALFAIIAASVAKPALSWPLILLHFALVLISVTGFLFTVMYCSNNQVSAGITTGLLAQYIVAMALASLSVYVSCRWRKYAKRRR